MNKIELIDGEIKKAKEFLNNGDFKNAPSFIKRVMDTYSSEINNIVTGFSDYEFFRGAKTDNHIRNDLNLLISKLELHKANLESKAE